MKKPEVKKGESWRRGYQIGYDEGIKATIIAFGRCLKCYGKGYGTQTATVYESADFEGDKSRSYKAPTVVFCKCSRGKQLQKLWPN